MTAEENINLLEEAGYVLYVYPDGSLFKAAKTITSDEAANEEAELIFKAKRYDETLAWIDEIYQTSPHFFPQGRRQILDEIKGLLLTGKKPEVDWHVMGNSDDL